MTNSQELFGEQEASPAQETKVDQPESKEQEVGESSPLSELVGEGKKYATVEELAKSRLEAEEHIKRIEAENAEFRKQQEATLKEKSNYDAILQKLENQKSVSNSDNQDAQKTSSSNQDIDIEDYVNQVLTKREREQFEQANISKAKELVAQTYGNFEEGKKVVDEFLKHKPYMTDAIRTLLRTDPETFVAEIKNYKSPDQIKNSAIDPVGDIPNVNFNVEEGVITWKEAQKVRKENIKKYSSPEFQALMDKSRAYYTQKGVVYSNT